jgi:hypothetical protein
MASGAYERSAGAMTRSKLMIPKSVQRLEARGRINGIKTETEMTPDGGRTCRIVRL